MSAINTLLKFSAVDNVSSKLQGITSKMNEMSKATDKSSLRLQKLRDSSQDASGMLSKLKMVGLAGVIGGFIGAIKYGGQFEDSLADLSSLTGVSGKALQDLGDDMLEMSTKYIVSSSSISKAMTQIGSDKPELLSNAEALKKVTESALTLAKASGMEVPAAASALTTSLNQFNMKGEESSKVMDILAAGAKYGSSEIAETSAALKGAGTSANMAHVSFLETNAAIQVLAKSSIKGAEAGTNLRNIFLKLEATGEKDLMPSVVGINKSLENLKKANLDTTQATKLFGLESYNAAMTLINNKKLFEQFLRQITETGVAMEQAKVRMATFNQSLLKLWYSVKKLLIKAFAGLSVVLTPMVNSIISFTEWIQKGSVGAKVFAWAVGIAGAGLTALLVPIGLIKFKSLIVGLKNSSKAFLVLSKDAWVSTAKASWSVTKFTASMIKNFAIATAKASWSIINFSAKLIKNFAVATAKTSLSIVKFTASMIKNFAVATAKTSLSIVKFTASMIKNFAVATAKAGTSMLKFTAKFGASLIPILLSGTSALFGFATGVWATIAPILAVVGITSLIIGAIVALGYGIYKLWQNWDEVWGWIKNSCSATVDWIIEKFNQFANWSPISALMSAWQPALDWIGNAFDATIGKIIKTYDKVKKIVTHPLDSIKSGVSATVEWAGDALSSTKNSVVGWISGDKTDTQKNGQTQRSNAVEDIKPFQNQISSDVFYSGTQKNENKNKLEVSMKIDSDGRPSITNTKSDSNLDFNADLGSYSFA
jgi:TP901 family phage tail tape measure protein